MKWKFQDTKSVESLCIPFHFIFNAIPKECFHFTGFTQMENFAVHLAIFSCMFFLGRKVLTDYSWAAEQNFRVTDLATIEVVVGSAIYISSSLPYIYIYISIYSMHIYYYAILSILYKCKYSYIYIYSFI